MLFLSKITILHIFYRFGDHKKKKKIRHMRPHKLQPNEKCVLLMEFRCHGISILCAQAHNEGYYATSDNARRRSKPRQSRDEAEA